MTFDEKRFDKQFESTLTKKKVVNERRHIMRNNRMTYAEIK